MTTFNNLVEDLTKENLLDDRNYSARQKFRNKKVTDFPSSIELLRTSTPDILELAENHDLKLPDFSFFQPENILELGQEDRIKPVLTDSSAPGPFHSTEKFIRFQQTRRKTKTQKKGAKFCQHCEIYMPFYTMNCRFCHGRLTAGLSYYLMIALGVVMIVLFLFIVLANKSYK